MQGDFEAFYLRHFKAIYRVCYAFMKNAQDAEDCTEDAFVRAMTSNATVDIYDRDGNVVSADIEEGTILVDPDVFFMRNIGSVNNTIIHECVHWESTISSSSFRNLSTLNSHLFPALSLRSTKKGPVV